MLIVDRFEGEWAVLELDGKTFNVPRSLLPETVREGDVLSLAFGVSKVETMSRRAKIRDLENRLFKE